MEKRECMEHGDNKCKSSPFDHFPKTWEEFQKHMAGFKEGANEKMLVCLEKLMNSYGTLGASFSGASAEVKQRTQVEMDQLLKTWAEKKSNFPIGIVNPIDQFLKSIGMDQGSKTTKKTPVPVGVKTKVAAAPSRSAAKKKPSSPSASVAAVKKPTAKKPAHPITSKPKSTRK